MTNIKLTPVALLGICVYINRNINIYSFSMLIFRFKLCIYIAFIGMPTVTLSF